jgi:hypothetical protein
VSNFEVPNPILKQPFEERREHWWIPPGRPGVKMIDSRGNELLVVKKPEAAR